MPVGFQVENHPEKKKIIEMILAGKPVREIGRSVSPPIEFNAIQRYKSNVLKPVLANAELSSSILIRQNRPLTPLSDDTQALQMTKSAILAAPILTIRDQRISAKVDRHRRLQMIVDERAADMESVPGGQSGFLTRDFKGAGDSMTEVYKFDAPLEAAFGAIEKDIAIELGQWNENAGGSGISIQIICPQAPELESAPRISYSESDQLTLESGVCADIGVIQKK